jgi:ABC-type microcin C transport system permease subunit YejB
MNDPGQHDGGLRRAVARKGSLRRTMKAVAWSFFGVRKSAEHEYDLNHLNPVHVIIAGIVAAALFILALILLVRFAVGSLQP